MEEFSSVCQNCGSDLFYNPRTGSLTCKYCQSNFYLPTSRKNAVIVRQYSAGFHPNLFNKSLNSYKCKSCGNVYFMTTEGRSSRCPSCGNGDIELTEEPGFCADGVIPFKITKEKASEELEKYLKNNKKVPKALREMAKEQKMMAVLIPVWNFSFNMYASYSAVEAVVQKDTFGDYYMVHNPIYGNDEKRIESMDECATSGEDDAFLELFDEHDYANIVPYCPEYSFGSRVDQITKSIHEFYEKVTDNAKKDFERKIKRKLLARKNDVTEINVSSRVDDVFFNFTYVPVYVNVFKYKKKVYKLYVSGTTGKVAGKTPVSTGYKVGKFLKIVGIGALIALVYKLFKK